MMHYICYVYDIVKRDVLETFSFYAGRARFCIVHRSEAINITFLLNSARKHRRYDYDNSFLLFSSRLMFNISQIVRTSRPIHYHELAIYQHRLSEDH